MLNAFFQPTADTSTLRRISQLKSCEMWITCRCCLGKTGMLGSLRDNTVIFVDGLNSANMAIEQSAYLRPKVDASCMATENYAGDYGEL
jgi:hypothetical protein